MATAESIEQSLADDGYVRLDEFKGLKPGARVYHSGHRWGDASTTGTTTVISVWRKTGGWEQTYGRPNIEVVAEMDKPQFGQKVAQWADYHTHLAFEQPEQES